MSNLEIDSSLGLPVKFHHWREDQLSAVEAIVASDRPVFLADLPTGVGKSLVGIGAHRILKQSCVYITRTKQLQNQIMCVAPETLILTADLRWKLAGDIKVGEEVMGFDEKVHGGGNRSMWHKTIVLASQRVIRPTYRLTFDDGTVVSCSSDHCWLRKHAKAGGWLKTENLRVGGLYASKIKKLVNVWREVNDRAAGMVASSYPGEINGYRKGRQLNLGGSCDSANTKRISSQNRH
jgi:hypothetical protein